jgi:uncharacterized protein (TIGR03435 family)
MAHRIFTLSMVASFSLITLGYAQPPANARTEFEVASIKPHVVALVNGRGRMGMSFSGPGVRVEGMTLNGLISYAYNLNPIELSGGPNWAGSDKYDVVAKAEGDGVLARESARLMMQSLLADRFKLKFHRESREVSGYALVLAKGGSKLKENAPDAASSMSMVSPSGMRGEEMTVSRWTMQQLASQLAVDTRLPVSDRTGLTKSYDFKLTWVSDRELAESPDAPPSAPLLVTALQEQLGLKLESLRVPMEILVIDSAQHPSEN